MAIEDAFNGAKTAFTFWNAYINTVAEEIGMERALGLNTKMCESMVQAKMMKEEAGIKEFDAKAAWSLMRTAPEGLGLSSEVVEESPQRVVVKYSKCSIYEAAQMLGMGWMPRLSKACAAVALKGLWAQRLSNSTPISAFG
jgi:hypothetical protein